MQMNEPKPMQDVSVSMSARDPSRHDVSVGHSVLKQDVSISPSLHIADAGIDPREVILYDVSIEQTQKSMN